jgi:hypothetical protein
MPLFLTTLLLSPEHHVANLSFLLDKIACSLIRKLADSPPVDHDFAQGTNE